MGASYEGLKFLVKGKTPVAEYVQLAHRAAELQMGQHFIHMRRDPAMSEAKARDAAMRKQKQVAAALDRGLKSNPEKRKALTVARTENHDVVVVYPDPAHPIDYKPDPLKMEAPERVVVRREKGLR